MNNILQLKKGFPNKILGIPVGWKDKGNPSSLTERHSYCNSYVHIGIENGEIFKFCPICLIKLEDRPNKK